MKPAPFSYLRAQTVGDAIQALGEHGEEARIIAGGQSLMAMLNMRLTEPGLLIDISRIGDLKRIEVDDRKVRVGAAVTQGELAAHEGAMAALPILGEALTHVGHMQTRNRGTVCGSLCHADPSAEMPLLLATLGGSVSLEGPSGTRTLYAADFQTGMLTTAREADEVCISADFPRLPASARAGFREVARRHGDFAIVAMTCLVDGGNIRLGVGGVADTPVVEEWDSLSSGEVDDALNGLAWRLGGYDDIHASARYRRELVRRLGKALIEEARA